MNLKHRGALSELQATAWLIEMGYEVFRNVSQHGIVDLVALDPETKETTFIDVTTGHYYQKKGGGVTLHYAKKNHLPPHVKVLIVTPDGKFIWKHE